MEVGFFPLNLSSFNPAGQWDVAGYLNKAMVISNKHSVMCLAASVQALGMFLRFQ